MGKILVISGHPNLAGSYTNKAILAALESSGLDLTIRRLDALYCDFNVDVAAEQKALLDADTIVLQFPFYWYSVPALLKNWIDQVFGFNFAYGPEGDKLKGKNFVLSFTIGGPKEAYQPLGYNHFPIEELIKPLQQTAYLAQVTYLPPIYSHAMIYIPGVYNTEAEVVGRAKEHAERLIHNLSGL